ncbi:beta-galactosidase subunit alpha, partial [Paenibacillus sepulcri]|nr:beta-galactosidase subunit alpha [Paenibacillus sepulcri]
HYAESPDMAPGDFMARTYSDNGWSEIPVPGNWQMHGWGIPHYSSCPYPFPVDPPHVPANNPVGCYRTAFRVKDSWADREIRLMFEGVDSAFHLWINGEPAGYSQGSHFHSEFDITRFLVPGDNILAVQVYQWCDGSYLESQDKWRLSGIFRDVYLLALPAVTVRDAFVQTRLDESLEEAELTIRLNVAELAAGSGYSRSGWTLQLALLDAEHHPVVSRSEAVQFPDGEKELIIPISESVSAPRTWTA